VSSRGPTFGYAPLVDSAALTDAVDIHVIDDGDIRRTESLDEVLGALVESGRALVAHVGFLSG
jgi:hypothetical protein